MAVGKAQRQRFVHRNPEVHSVVKVTRYTTVRNFRVQGNLHLIELLAEIDHFFEVFCVW
jgi:hypothetical protein